ncbi:MAG: nickel pincer cofactor biosynthesis protein LarB [Actinomycetota bacterium]|nr:nickel pincer cofactor biosynthesis protein LarB [Actinomycetota bacterium]
MADGTAGVFTPDHEREERCGFAEVVFAEGKTAAHVCSIAERIIDRSGYVLMTRVRPDQEEALEARFDDLVALPSCRLALIDRRPDGLGTRNLPADEDLKVARLLEGGIGQVMVACAGTSDLPVAREAAITARFMGSAVQLIADIGIAGIHRLLAHEDDLRRARAIAVVAGMEGALPSAVAGLVDVPVIAVPTSVGYGASFGGLAALLGMLNSCAGGVSVVNIDNGFGAGQILDRINRPPARFS